MGTVVALHPGAAPSQPADARGQMVHASLQLHESRPGKTGKDALGEPCGTVEFQFNPKELSLTKAAKWERKPARGAKTAGPPEFRGAEPSKLTLELFFDAGGRTDGGGVVGRVETLLSCCVPTETTVGQKRALPPLVVFHWGPVVGFPAFISSVGVKYSLFASDGTPLRATCSVTLEELAGEMQGQNPTSGALAARSHHTVVAGDTLASLAYREYGDPELWRALAAYNGIDDPLRVRTETELLLPSPSELPGL